MEYLNKINQQVAIMIPKNKIQQLLTHQKTHLIQLITLDNKTIKQIQQKYQTKTKQTTKPKSQSLLE
jgi:hypothetical protein